MYHDRYYGDKAYPKKEIKPCKYDAYQPFKKANFSFMTDKQIKEFIDMVRVVR